MKLTVGRAGLAQVLRRGVPVVLRSDVAARVAITATIGTGRVGAATARLAGGRRTVTVRLVLGRAARHPLAARRSARIVVKAVFQPEALFQPATGRAAERRVVVVIRR